jgi:hypothetical protein
MQKVMDEQVEQQDIAPAAAVNSSQPEPSPSNSLVAVLDRVADPASDSQWDLSTKRTVLVIMLIVVVFVIYISRNILPMVLIAAILAYLLSPIINFAQRFRIPRLISTVVVYLLIIALLVLVPIIFIPTLVDQLRALATFDASGAARAVINWANDTVQGLPETVVVLGYPLPVAEYVRQVQSNSQQVSLVPSVSDILGSIQQFLSTTTNVVSSTASFGINVVNSISGVFSQPFPDFLSFRTGGFAAAHRHSLAVISARPVDPEHHRGHDDLAGAVAGGDARRADLWHSRRAVGSSAQPGADPGDDPRRDHGAAARLHRAGAAGRRPGGLRPDHRGHLFSDPAVGEQHPGAAHHRRQHQPPPDCGDLRRGRGV